MTDATLGDGRDTTLHAVVLRNMPDAVGRLAALVLFRDAIDGTVSLDSLNRRGSWVRRAARQILGFADRRLTMEDVRVYVDRYDFTQETIYQEYDVQRAQSGQREKAREQRLRRLGREAEIDSVEELLDSQEAARVDMILEDPTTGQRRLFQEVDDG